MERLRDGGVATIDADRTLVFFRADGSIISSAVAVIDTFDYPVGVFAYGTLAFRTTSNAPVTLARSTD